MLLIQMFGCGKPSYGLQVSGKVFYDGKPVPAGSIIFEPDVDKGNQGRTFSAEIMKGHYRTEAGKGALPGDYLVTVYGFDETVASELQNTALFQPYQTSLKIDTQHTSPEFNIPKK